MNELKEVSINCPYCGEPLDILADGSAGEQDYIEDCQVCCKPMVIRLSFGPDGMLEVEARHEDDV